MAPKLEIVVLSLRYSSWSIRPWLALAHAGAEFETRTMTLEDMWSAGTPVDLKAQLPGRREKGSVAGLFPVLHVDGEPVHESLAIAEYVADAFPEAKLWPSDPVARARARAICCEMATGFRNVREDLSCHIFARVPTREQRPETRAELDRIEEMWRECLKRSGGPFLFGHFTIADCFYYPVITRMRTYGVPIPEDLEPYCTAVETCAPVQALLKRAVNEPRISAYDAMVTRLGGDPDAAMPPAAP